MVCLLCHGCSGDHISLSSPESSKSNISSVLFKHFRFIFESEPVYGDVCRECWKKVEIFHVFYQHIEEIHTTIMKMDPLVVEQIDGEIKNEDSESQMQKNDCQLNIPPNIESKDFKTQSDSNSERLTNEQMKSKSRSKSIVAKIKMRKTIKKNVKSSIDIKTEECNETNVHGCPINRKCKKFETKDALIAHCALEHKRFHCTHCPNIRLFADLYKHLRDNHGIIENAICEHCGQTFGCNRTLIEHIKRKHTVSDPVQCDICKEWFKSRETIRSHMNYVHIQGPQTCGICGKVSANRKALRTHLTIHSEAWKDKFKCVICGKGFRTSTKMREHSYIHSGKTDAYECQFCKKKFRFNSSISTHRMKFHPLEMAPVIERLQRKRNMEFKV